MAASRAGASRAGRTAARMSCSANARRSPRHLPTARDSRAGTAVAARSPRRPAPSPSARPPASPRHSSLLPRPRRRPPRRRPQERPRAGRAPRRPAPHAVVTDTVTTTVRPQRLLARVSSASATRSGLRRTLVVHLATSAPATATIVTRGPHSLVLRRSYRLHPPRATLRILLPSRARPGRYRLTIRLADAKGHAVTLHPTIRIRR